MNQAELERRARFEDMRCRGTGSVIKHKIFCQGCIDCDWVARKAYDDPEWAAAIGGSGVEEKMSDQESNANEQTDKT